MKTTFQVQPRGDREIVISRDFAAPRRLVWEAMTKPEFLRRWLFGPPGWEMTVCEDDLRVGGAFRWAWRGANGEEMSMRGVNREIVPLERITVAYPSKEARDGALASGMEKGISVGYDRLDEILASKS